jgi:hypothetical protein
VVVWQALPAVSQAHKDAFERVKLEHEAVVSLLRVSAVDKRRRGRPRKDPSSGSPLQERALMETAAAAADDAYALLLIAKAEGFMRSYLAMLGIPLPAEPKLGTLIDQCRKEFNRREARHKIHPDAAAELHDLRRRRNTYAHGEGSSVFPSVGRIVTVLGRFFNDLP